MNLAFLFDLATCNLFSRCSFLQILVQATMHVYKSVVEKFLPTPSKSHYVFNLRDFARVVFGVLLVPSTHLQEGDKLIRLWIHEVYRVFYDRLIDSNDRVMFFDMMKETTKQHFKKDMDGLLDHIVPTGQKLKDDHIRLFKVPATAESPTS